MKTSLSGAAIRPIVSRLAKANRVFAVRYPGEAGRRQPVHTVYGGAHLFRADAATKLGAAALCVLEEYAPDSAALAAATGMPVRLAGTVYARVLEKLRREPVEDFRVDFEDGYGNRADAEEDGHAAQVATEMARGMAARKLPPFVGIRIKPFSEELRARSFRTLDIVVSTLAREACGKLPANFVVTLPKVALPEQVAALVDLFALLERATRLPRGALKMELMIETPQSILNVRGESAIPHLVAAGRGRVVAAHFGTYDYTASCNITAAYQHMMHPVCDFAKHVMQVALAGTRVWLSDGATNIMPVPLHRAAPDGPPLTRHQKEENRAAVHRAWKLHYDHIQHSLIGGYYQGWDLHPAQLPTRYAAVFAFFLESLDAASARLKNFVERAARATLVGEIFDDAATGQGLLNYFLRAINCGAISEQEAVERTGVAAAELRSSSFVKILKNRRRLE